MQTTYTSGAVLTINRPDGTTEDVVNTKHARDGVIPAAIYAAMVKATREAGKGEIVGQRPNVVAVPLDVQRMAIAGELEDCAGAFPGSREWHKGVALEKELAAFDGAHPEVIAEIRAARTARTAEGVARALRMED